MSDKENNPVLITECIDILYNLVISRLPIEIKPSILNSNKNIVDVKTLIYYGLLDQLLHQSIIELVLDTDNSSDNKDSILIYDSDMLTQLLMSCQIPIKINEEYLDSKIGIYESTRFSFGTLINSYFIEFPTIVRDGNWKDNSILSTLIICVVNIVVNKVKSGIRNQLPITEYSEHCRTRISKFIRESIHTYYLDNQIENLNDIIDYNYMHIDDAYMCKLGEENEENCKT